jgi:hypothetical protein
MGSAWAFGQEIHCRGWQLDQPPLAEQVSAAPGHARVLRRDGYHLPVATALSRLHRLSEFGTIGLCTSPF